MGEISFLNFLDTFLGCWHPNCSTPDPGFTGGELYKHQVLLLSLLYSDPIIAVYQPSANL